MKLIKRIILALFIITSVGILFRGGLYRHLVTYKSIGQRTNYDVKETNLADYIDENFDKQSNREIQTVIKLGLFVTSKKLNFLET